MTWQSAEADQNTPAICKKVQGPQNSFKRPLFRHFVWDIVPVTSIATPLTVKSKLQQASQNEIYLSFAFQHNKNLCFI
jgi:hypothetical protein